MREEIDSFVPDEAKAMAAFGRAATVSQWAAAAGEDVTQLDEIIDQGFYIMRRAGRKPAYLFPVADIQIPQIYFLDTTAGSS